VTSKTSALAATDAIGKRRRAIEEKASNLDGVMIELELANGGEVPNVISQFTWKNLRRNARRGG
jgi:hypothetical protein